MIENQIWLDRVIHTALEEDLGGGDLTTDAIIDPKIRGKAALEARQPMILAGLPVFRRVFQILCSEIEFENFFEDGHHVSPGEKICFLSGPLSAILKAERTALNFIQRMSGIATLTRKFVEKAGSGSGRATPRRR